MSKDNYIDEKKVRQLHHEAMDLCDEGFFARRNKETEKAIDAFKKAFALEKEAAMLLKDKHECEPTRGVMFRSAGWIAIDAGLLDDAVEMANIGLEGKELHNEIREELNEVLEEVKKLKG